MALKVMPAPSSGGVPSIDSEVHAAMFSAYRTEGFVRVDAGSLSTECAVVENSPTGMSVILRAGIYYISDGSFARILVVDADVVLAISNGDGSNDRIDRVVLTYVHNNGADTFTAVIKEGTPAGGPTPPSLTTVIAGTYEVSMAQILVIQNETTEVVDGDITDERTTSSHRDVLVTRIIDLPATTFVAPASNGAAAGTTNGTNFSYQTLDFSTSVEEHADVVFSMPDAYDGLPITATAYWTAASGSGTVAWELNTVSLADDDVYDSALTDVGSITDTKIASGDLHVASTTWSTSLPVAGERIVLRVSRDVAADTLGVDAKLIGIKLEFGTIEA